ncbi:hypothetical protein IV203_005061 [Nitzschia inconspicua]|uniref:Uncharacterized protein n=1 Tax=Nitzschia inconspicua TaxID=303405 RepID=A0A9K3KLM4_9STRA|nr:hypothetical protein IV203_005061 [Nitzschia inconspicua]
MSFSSNKRAPFSTFRPDDKSSMFPTAMSNGNVLNFTPPGFKQSLNVKFPDCRLAVCESCKKNFKTRDMCRVRNEHTAAPWTTAYICMTLDDSCLDEHGRYVDKPMICRMVEWQPFRVLRDFDKKTPVCATCKRTNRTRNFCRDRHKHRQLPWCTVYVMLSTLDSADPSTIVAPSSKPIGATVSSDTEDSKIPPTDAFPSEEAAAVPETEAASKERVSSESPPLNFRDEISLAESKASDLSENISPGDDAKRLAELGVGDDINKIAESRTMLIKVSTVGTVITWLESGDDGQLSRRNLAKALEEYPNAAVNPSAETATVQQHGLDPNQYIWPTVVGVPQQSVAQHPHFYHHMQQMPHVHYVVPPGWHYVHPPHTNQQYEYPVAQPPPHQHPQPHQQYVPIQYVPAIQPSPIPSTPVTGSNTPVAASSPAAAPSPAPVTAGEAAAAQRQRRNFEEAESHERRVSQSPVEPRSQPQQQQPPSRSQTQHHHTLVHGLAAPLHQVQGMVFVAPSHTGHGQGTLQHSPTSFHQHHQPQWMPYQNPIYHPQHTVILPHAMQYPNSEAQGISPNSPPHSTEEYVRPEPGSKAGTVMTLHNRTYAAPSGGKDHRTCLQMKTTRGEMTTKTV